MTTRYCAYCLRAKPSAGFKLVLRKSSNVKPRYICSDCLELRRKSREELETLARVAKEERKQKI